MLRTRLSKRFKVSYLLGVCATLALTGCPEPDGVTDDFLERREPYTLAPDMGELSDAGMGGVSDLTGMYLLAIGTELDPSKPLLFRAEIQMDMVSDPPMLTLNLVPLQSWCGEEACMADAADFRSDVPPVIEAGSVPVGPTGQFTVDLGEVSVGGAVNALSGADITATLALDARTLGDGDFCGKVSGALSAPFAFPLKPATNGFGVVLIPDGVDVKTLNTIAQCF